MKEMVIGIGVFIIICCFFSYMLNKIDQKVELMCRKDCYKMSAVYAHHDMGMNGYPDSCSCFHNGETKPIW